jgi:hypothetical protein
MITRTLKRRKQRAKLKSLQSELNNLSLEEKAVLASYIAHNTKTIHLGMNSGLAGGLEAAGIIFRSSNIGSMGTGIAYNIQPWAWDYLREHPELLYPERSEEQS